MYCKNYKWKPSFFSPNTNYPSSSSLHSLSILSENCCSHLGVNPPIPFSEHLHVCVYVHVQLEVVITFTFNKSVTEFKYILYDLEIFSI